MSYVLSGKFNIQDKKESQIKKKNYSGGNDKNDKKNFSLMPK